MAAAATTEDYVERASERERKGCERDERAESEAAAAARKEEGNEVVVRSQSGELGS